jgi:hypothetical protein
MVGLRQANRLLGVMLVRLKDSCAKDDRLKRFSFHYIGLLTIHVDKLRLTLFEGYLEAAV